MISKNKLLLALFLIFVCINLQAAKNRSTYATKNVKGQDYYLNRCSTCHGDASRGGNISSIREWKNIFSKNAQELKEIHLDDEENIKILKYFDSKDFEKESLLILPLLQEFAYDSENIPTCN